MHVETQVLQTTEGNSQHQLGATQPGQYPEGRIHFDSVLLSKVAHRKQHSTSDISLTDHDYAQGLSSPCPLLHCRTTLS